MTFLDHAAWSSPEMTSARTKLTGGRGNRGNARYDPSVLRAALATSLVLGCLACRSSEAPAHPAPMIDAKALPALVRARLVEEHAASSGELLGDRSTRELAAGPLALLPGTNGQRGYVVLLLQRDTLPIATELGLRFDVAVDSAGATTLGDPPARADLATAVRLAVETERRALDAAGSALDAAGHRAPSTWPAALRTLRLDPRLPAGQFVGEPTWQLIFDPWDEARGGYHSVVLAVPSLAVRDVR